MPNSPQHAERFARAVQSLQGLSCGDAFGERFFVYPDLALSLIAQRALPSPPWRYTDDTVMAIAIVEILEELGEIHPELLAENFGKHYLNDPQRGYGAAMHTLLPELSRTPSIWKERSQSLFNGRGSFGNGAAMRVAPLGAYFADDLATLVRQAELSALVTHSHPEAVAGALAVALAAALAWQHRQTPIAARDYLKQICDRLPESEVRRGIVHSTTLPDDARVDAAAALLGSGSRVTAQDTVPFCLWVAAHHLSDYLGALWATAGGLGDIDTTCAIVGGIVTQCAGIESIPSSWLESREPIPAWFLYPRPDQS